MRRYSVLVIVQLLISVLTVSSSDIQDANTDQLFRSKRTITGGITIEDPNNPIYNKMAEESLIKYLREYGLPEVYSNVHVNKVTSQVVGGWITRIDFDAILGIYTGVTCHSEIFEQPWLHRKDIDVTCKYSNMDRKAGGIISGGITEKDPNNPLYRRMAEESLKKYVNEYYLDEGYYVLLVKRVTEQLVAGTLTRIDFDAVIGDSSVVNCHSKILDQPWINRWQNNIDVTCQHMVLKNAGPVYGGQVVKDPSNPRYRQMAEESLKKYLDENNLYEVHYVLVVKRVTEQVVAGTLTRIDFDGVLGGQFVTCHSEVLDQAWKKWRRIKVTCQNIFNS